MVAFGTPGTAGAQTSIYITPDLAGNTLYYYCNTHSGMGGSLSIATLRHISLLKMVILILQIQILNMLILKILTDREISF